MWKIIVLFVLLFIEVQALDKKDRLQEIKSPYAYGLLTDDYGVLSTDDLKINSCGVIPHPFSEKGSEFPYWQCFETKDSKLFCEGPDYDEDEKTQVSWLIFSGVLNGELHEYMTRRFMHLKSCRLYLKSWRRLTSNEKYVCVSGMLMSRHKDKKLWAWIFDRYKTKKGCESYFVGGCSLRYQISHGYCND